MKISRVFTTISLVLLSAESLACYYWTPTPDDNDIFRIVENLSPYNDGLYPFNQIIEDRSVSEDYFREQDLLTGRFGVLYITCLHLGLRLKGKPVSTDLARRLTVSFFLPSSVR